MIKVINLKDCDFNKVRKTLSIPARFVNGFPREIIVHSHHTGRDILFRTLDPSHPDFDEDGWDGEQALYAPVQPLSTINTLAIYHDC